jgi:hypothetical protein
MNEVRTHVCVKCGERKASDEMHKVNLTEGPHSDGQYRGVCVRCHNALSCNPFYHVDQATQAALYVDMLRAWSRLIVDHEDIDHDMADAFQEDVRNAIFLMRKAGVVNL